MSRKIPNLANSVRPVSLAAAMMMGTTPAIAQTYHADETRNVEEIIVEGKKNKRPLGLSTIRTEIIDTPQVISSVSAEVLLQRGITSLEQALRNVAGVTSAVGEGGVLSGDQFFIRGQAAKNDIFTDGLRDFGAFTRDSFNYESVQVLKGSSGTTLGRGVTGGGVNTVSKLPQSTDDFSVISGSFGAADYKRLTGDVNWAFSDSVGFRVNIMATDTDAVDRDDIYSRRFGIAPSVAFGLGTDTQFKALYFHQSEEKLADFGVPIAMTSSGQKQFPVTEFGVPRSNFYGFLADTDKVNVNTLTLLFSHDANDWLSFTSDTKLGIYSRTFRQTVPGCRTRENCGDFLLDNDPTTVPLGRTTPRGAYDQTTRGIQNISTAFITAPLGSMRYELLVGVDTSYQTNDRTDQVRPDPYIQDIFNPVREPQPVYFTDIYRRLDTHGSDLSLFINKQLWILPTVSVSAGLRYQNFKNNQERIEFTTSRGDTLTNCNGISGSFTTCVVPGTSRNNLWSPKISVLWEPSDEASVYFSYSKALTPPGNAIGIGDTLRAPRGNNAISRSHLDPESTETYDLGAKLKLFDGQVLVQTAVYQINRQNSVEVDPESNNIIATRDPKQRIRGFELGVNGAVTTDMSINANYAYINADIREAYSGGWRSPATINPALVGNQVRLVPEHSLSLWANYTPQNGQLEGFEIGVGLSYQSEIFLDNENIRVLPSYTSVDALLAYNFGKVRIALNAYNLTDKLYYAQGQSSRAVPAAGRNIIGTIGVAF